MPQRCGTHVATPENSVDLPRARSMRAAPTRHKREHRRATGPPTTNASQARQRSTRTKVDTLGIEPRAFRMRSGCDTTTPCAHDIPAQISPYFSEHRWSSGRIHRSQPSPPLPLLFSCVCCRGCPSSSASSCSAVPCSVSSWLGGGLGAMSRRREIHGAATITARRPATLRAQALPGRLELPTLRLTAPRSSHLS